MTRVDVWSECVRLLSDPDVWMVQVRASFVRQSDVRAVAVLSEI